MRRDNSRKDRSSLSTLSPQTPTSNRKVFRSWSNEDSGQKQQHQQHTTSPSIRKSSKAMYALEYGTEQQGPGGANSSWPHSEWTTLATIISENEDDVTGLGVNGISFFSKQGMRTMQGLDTRSSARGPRISYGQHSIHCIENISDCMWVVAIVKDLERPANVWHWQAPRPSTESVEDNLRDLVSNLASMIRTSDRFEAPSARLLRDKFLERSSDEIGAGLAEELKERGIDTGEISQDQAILFIKNQLKVLAQSHATAGSSIATSRLLRRRRGRKLNHTGHLESAAAFFLGHELMNTMIFD